jgi:hypothetical protein
MLLYDIASPDRAAHLLRRLYDDQEGVTRIQTPYFMFYVLEALYRHHKAPLALALIRSRWKPLLDRGATTWWERFDQSGGECRLWSVAPSFELPARLLGISPQQPGFRGVRIAPDPCDLTHAEGSVPSVAGDIRVCWEKAQDDAAFKMEVSIPPKCGARIGIPRLGMKFPEVTLDKEVVWRNEKLFPNRLVREVHLEGDHVFFHIGRGGTYTFTSAKG